MDTSTFSGICSRLGAPLHNPRWSWCALSPDGKLAIFTVWQDKFVGMRYPILYHNDRKDNANPNRPGWTEITRVVMHCITNSDTEILGVLSRAHQPIGDPRIREWVDGRDLLVLKIEPDSEGKPWARIVGRRSLFTLSSAVTGPEQNRAINGAAG